MNFTVSDIVSVVLSFFTFSDMFSLSLTHFFFKNPVFSGDKSL